MAEMYSKNHAVSYKLHIIKQTVNTINCNDYMNLRLNFAIVIKRCDEAKFGSFMLFQFSFPPAVPKSCWTVTLKSRYVPNHHICVLLHP